MAAKKRRRTTKKTNAAREKRARQCELDKLTDRVRTMAARCTRLGRSREDMRRAVLAGIP